MSSPTPEQMAAIINDPELMKKFRDGMAHGKWPPLYCGITTASGHGLRTGDTITIPLPWTPTRWQRFKQWLGFDAQPVGTYTVTAVASSNSFEIAEREP